MTLFPSHWTPVTPADAARQPTYGFGGWLLLFYVYAIISLVLPLMSVFGGEGTAAMFGAANVTMMRGVNAARLILLIPFLVLAPFKHPAMPSVTIACTWISFAIMAAAMIIGDISGRRLVIVMAMDGATALIYTAYLVYARRVNVTYRQRVPAAAM